MWGGRTNTHSNVQHVEEADDAPEDVQNDGEPAHTALCDYFPCNKRSRVGGHAATWNKGATNFTVSSEQERSHGVPASPCEMYTI